MSNLNATKKIFCTDKMELSIKAEWEAVKNTPSLFKHYGNQKEYQKWRERFVRAGYLHKKPRRAKQDRLVYNRAYYAKWRVTHKDRIIQYTHDHWQKKLGCVQIAQ